ncbi:MAG: 30S ribosomal protein S12 methylthiotransferase RimO [Flavobacteriales bacterium]|nr:30S ribosomal protein S12 methylthiotransferase RimO [Flavobacteriales bacterium]
MRTKGKQKTVNVVTLGCSKNLFDSERMLAQLQANEFDVSHNQEKSTDIVIVNTCGFIDSAKEESINTILDFVRAKEAGHIEKLIVTGCLSERYGGDLKKEIPEVDAYFGTGDLPRLLKTLKADYKRELVGERLLTTPSHYAYLKISEGCNRKCSFCAIPLMRGKHQSRAIEDIVKEAQSLAAKGVKELMLIAQELTFYGLDLYKERALAKLLRALGSVDGIEWIRLHYAYPSGFPEDILDEIASNPKVCNYLDIPLQHVSSSVLKRMKRGLTKETTSNLIKKIRDTVPGIAIRSTFLVGFPGETEEEFQELKDWVQEYRLDRIGVFTYSHEENTSAFSLENDVDEMLKVERSNELMEVQSGISWELNQSKIGSIQKVLIDSVDAEHYVGRTEFDSPDVDNEVLIKTDEHLRVGDFIEVKIIDCADYDLYGVPLNQD